VSSRRVLALVGIALVLLTAPELGLALGAPLSSFSFQTRGGPPLLVLRLGVLVFTLSALRDAFWSAGVVIALFVLSLAASCALYPFLIVSVALVALGRASREPGRTEYVVLYGSLLTALALAALPHLRREPIRPDPDDPPRMVTYWQGRQNLYQARWWAVAWSRAETSAPGDAYLTLASIDRQLGRIVQAKKVLAKVIEHPANEDVRRRAELLQATWEKEPVPP
jgi:hypothetical protein